MRERAEQIDPGLIVLGFVIGCLAGAAVALFNAPRSGAATRQQLFGSGQALQHAVMPTDPVAESMAAGKAAARRRAEGVPLDPTRP